MHNQQLKKIKLKVHGMHCASCEVLIERKFKKITGIERVNVSHVNGKTEIYYSKEPNMNQLQAATRKQMIPLIQM